MNSNFWRSKTTMITGATDGLGWALAEQIAAQGSHVILVARNQERLHLRQADLQRRGHTVSIYSADVTAADQVATMLERVRDEHGKLDCLVNNVGASTRSSLTQAQPSDFLAQMTINFFATINVTQLAMPLLLASRAHVVNIASLAGKSPWPFLGPYGASKAALVAYTHQLRVELRDRLQVLLVCPGPIAREDAGTRYLDAKHTLPQQAHLPGGGARIRGILPEVLATKIIRAIASGRAELVLPWHARLVFAIAQLSPRWGDWILRNFGGGKDIPALPVE